MAIAAKTEKQEIYGVFDGSNLIEIGSWDLVERALPYAGEQGEIISLACMSPSVLRLRIAELRLRQEDTEIPWGKRPRRPSKRDFALAFSSRQYETELEARGNESAMLARVRIGTMRRRTTN
jgi:hypothetical protein